MQMFIGIRLCNVIENLQTSAEVFLNKLCVIKHYIKNVWH